MYTGVNVMEFCVKDVQAIVPYICTYVASYVAMYLPLHASSLYIPIVLL